MSVILAPRKPGQPKKSQQRMDSDKSKQQTSEISKNITDNPVESPSQETSLDEK